MNCPACRKADLIEATFWFDRLLPDGTRFRTEVKGLRCPACGEEILRGPEAERVSEEWHRRVEEHTSIAVASGGPATDNSGESNPLD